MRGNGISSRITAGTSSATEARALKPSPAVITLMCSRCKVIWTILRTVGLSSTTSTVGSFIQVDLLHTLQATTQITLLLPTTTSNSARYQFARVVVAVQANGHVLIEYSDKRARPGTFGFPFRFP